MDDEVRWEATLALPALPQSAGMARRFVDALLQDAGREEWRDAARLLVSELVTNALLHARTPLEVTGRVLHDHLRIEVRDESSILPSSRDHPQEATTGRGLALVASMATAHGVRSLGDNGKVVWCTVGGTAVRAAGSEGGLETWDAGLDQTGVQKVLGSEPTAAAISLLGLPVTLWLAARDHHDALLRELALVRASSDEDEDEDGKAGGADLWSANRVRTMSGRAAATAVYKLIPGAGGTVGSGAFVQMNAEALTPTSGVVDVLLSVLPEDVDSFAKLQTALDEGERLAAAGKLLLRPGLPEIIALRNWACGQIFGQAAGGSPVAWNDVRDELLADVVTARREHPEAERYLRDSTATNQVVVDHANCIVAVQPSVVAALGWDHPQDLVGRRVVTLIPARFHDAHIAGFSRHMRTGESHILGIDLVLPVTRADGSEIDCRVRIEHVGDRGGTGFYVGQITPVAPE